MMHSTTKSGFMKDGPDGIMAPSSNELCLDVTSAQDGGEFNYDGCTVRDLADL